MSSIYTSNQIAAFWLILMTINNIGVTIINKALFANIHFPYPYMLTVIHMGINYIACQFIFYSIQQQHKSNQNQTKQPNIWIQLLGDDVVVVVNSPIINTPTSSTTTTKSSSSNTIIIIIIMIFYSMLFSMNIAIGNVSLQYVSINFNQVMRSLVPIIVLFYTYIINYYYNSNNNQRNSSLHLHTTTDNDDDDEKLKSSPIISFQRQIAVYFVVFGVIVATIGDRMSYTFVGLIYTLLCVILAAFKVIVSSELLTTTKYPQLKMHPLRLLYRMAPLAFLQCLFMSIITGEFYIIRQRWYIDLNPFTTGVIPILVLLLSGILAFSLNICALQAYKVTSPITCCIAAAVKQVLMVYIGTTLFHTPITLLNGCGILIVLFSSTYYSYLSITESKKVSVPVIQNFHSNSSSNEHHNDDSNNKPAASTETNGDYVSRTNNGSNNQCADHQVNHTANSNNRSMLDEMKHQHHGDKDDTIELGVPLLRRSGSNEDP